MLYLYNIKITTIQPFRNTVNRGIMKAIVEDTTIYVAYGVFGSQLYGPYSKEDIDFRSESGTDYADTLVYPEEGEDWDDFSSRMEEEYSAD